MKAPLLTVIICCLLAFQSIISREIDPYSLIQSTIDEETLDPETLQDLLILLEDKPDINTVSQHRLESIPGLSKQSVNTLLRLRKTGTLTSFESLYQKTNMDSAEILTMKTFFRIAAPRSWKFKMRHRMVLPMEHKRGIKNRHYLGNDLNTMHRLHLSSLNGIALGLIVEKDSGEKNWYDFYNGYVAFQKNNTSMIAGSFHVHTGYGLCFWGPYRQFRNLSARAYHPMNKLSVNRSSTELRKTMGLALQHQFGPAQIIIFTMNHQMDATLEEGKISTIIKSGLHRSPIEMEKKDNVQEKITGFNLIWRTQKLIMGCSGYHARTALPFAPKKGIANHFSTREPRRTVIAVHGHYRYNTLALFGEGCMDKQNRYVFYTGLSLQMNLSRILLTSHFYKPGFYNPLGKGAGKRGETLDNEKGIFLGWQQKWHRYTFQFYIDTYKHPWPTASRPMPVSGFRTGLETTLPITRLMNCRIRLQQDNSINYATTKDRFGNSSHCALIKKKKHIGLVLKITPKSSWNFITTIGYKDLYERPSATPSEPGNRYQGFLLSQTIKYKTSPVTLIAGFSLFDTDDWQARMYSYEYNVPGMFTFPAFHHRGSRHYIMLSCSLMSFLRLSGRFAHTFYDNLEIIGSGHDEIHSQHLRTIAVQIDFVIE